MRYKVLSFLVCIMISTTTFADFYDYIRQHRSGAQLFFFVKLEDVTNTNAADLKFCDYYKSFDNYIPTKINISPVNYNSSLYDGSYVVKEIKINIQNVLLDGSTRFIDNSASYQYETGLCTVYLGFDGITDSTDFLPYYQGNMTNFKYNMLSCEFTIIDKSILNLPDLPQNQFNFTDYPEINRELLDKPVPIIYGLWSKISGYIDRTFIPAFIVENKIDSNNNIFLRCASHGVYAIDEVCIYDEERKAMGFIQDDITAILLSSQIELDFNTANAYNFLTAHYYLHPTSGYSIDP